MEAQEIIDWIKQKQKKGGNPEEWFSILDAINEFYDSDKPESEKRKFYPLGYGESVGMVCDGLSRCRNCICARCKKKGSDIYSDSCSVYEAVPKEIWTVKDGNCQYYEEK